MSVVVSSAPTESSIFLNGNGFVSLTPESATQESFSFGMLTFVGNEPVLDEANRIYIRMCLDISGSMEGKKIEELLKTVRNMVRHFVDTPEFNKMDLWMEICTFNNLAKIVLPMQQITNQDASTVKAKFAEVTESIHPAGMTNIEVALKTFFQRQRFSNSEREECLLKIESFKSSLKEETDPVLCVKACEEAKGLFETLSQLPKNVRTVHVMFSDGEATIGDTDMKRVAETYVDNSAEYWWIGYGKSHSAKDLATLDKSEGRYLAITEEEHAGFAAGVVADAITNPGYTNVVFLITNGELFDGIRNCWVTELYYGSLSPVKKVEHYFKFTGNPADVVITLTATNSLTTEVIRRVFSPTDEMSPIDFLKATSRIQTLQHLKHVNDINMGLVFRTSIRETFSQLEEFVKELELTKSTCLGYELEIEDLIADIKIVMSTMGRGLRSAIFSTRLMNNWWSQSLRISTVHADDLTVRDYGNIQFEQHVEDMCGSLGRQVSENISPRCLQAMRSISQPVDDFTGGDDGDGDGDGVSLTDCMSGCMSACMSASDLRDEYDIVERSAERTAERSTASPMKRYRGDDNNV